ncbi:MAG: hypothetical protein CMO74_10075 [Verrucomicrobiales bacterium]|nr:hypothetical protein [Verrucomicrobiales bacterium]|tara:strand:- start:1184 stop:1720 length:537 start_codon:yes stop_codon:yes gene_type:complete
MPRYTIIGSDDREYGPISLDQVRAWIREGRADENTRVRPEGSQQWTVLGELSEFAELLGIAPPKTPGLPSLPVPKRKPAELKPPPGQQVEAPTTSNPWAGVSLAFAIGAMTCGCGHPLCWGVFAGLGIATSLMALNQIKLNPGQRGAGMAKISLAMSVASLLLFILAIGAVASLLPQK